MADDTIDWNLAKVAMPEPIYFNYNATNLQAQQAASIQSEAANQAAAAQQQAAMAPIQRQGADIRNQQSLADLQGTQMANQQTAAMNPYSLQQAQLGLQKAQAMTPIEIQQAQLGTQAKQQDLTSGKLDFGQKLNEYLYPAMLSVATETDPDAKSDKYQNMLDSINKLGVDPSAYGFGNKLDQSTASKIDNSVNMYKNSMMMKQVGTGLKSIVGPDGKPMLVPVSQALGQREYTPADEKVAVPKAMLQTGMADLPEIRNYFMPNGTALTGATLTRSLNFPGSQGQKINSSIDHILQGMMSVNPRYLNDPEKGMAELKKTYLPQVGDGPDEIAAKVQRLDQDSRGIYNSLGGDITKEGGTIGREAVGAVMNQSPDAVEQFKSNNPDFKNATDAQIKGMLAQRQLASVPQGIQPPGAPASAPPAQGAPQGLPASFQASNAMNGAQVARGITPVQNMYKQMGVPLSNPVVSETINKALQAHPNASNLLATAAQRMGGNVSPQNVIKQIYTARAEDIAKMPNRSPEWKQMMFKRLYNEAQVGYNGLSGDNQ